MRPLSLLLFAGAAAAGGFFGYISRPANHLPPPANPKIQPAVPENPRPFAIKAGEELTTMPGALAYMARLDKLSAPEVCQELRTLNYFDTLRKELASARFLRFSAAERLQALLEPPPTGAPPHIGAWNSLYMSTAAEMILADPAAVVKLLNDPAIGQFPDFGRVLEPLFARDGWEAAVGFLGKLPSHAQGETRSSLVALLAAQDLPRAQAECLKLPEGKDRNLLLGSVAKVMADKDPAAALEWVGRHFERVENEIGITSINVVAEVLRKVMQADPAGGAALLAEHQAAFSNHYGSVEVGELFKTWAATDFSAAEAWLIANPLGDDLQHGTISSIYQQRLGSLKNESEALALYQSLPSNLQAACAGSLLRKVGLQGLPAEPGEFYSDLPPDAQDRFESELRMMMPQLSTEERKQALAVISKSRHAQSGINYVFDSALEQVPESERDELLAGFAGPMRDELQVKQAREALQSGDLGKAQSLLLGLNGSTKDVLPHAEVAVHLADTNPAAGVEWVESLPEGNARRSAAANLAANWAKSDLDAAAHWASNLPPESGRDPAVQTIIRIQGLTGETGPALQLAATLSEESARFSAFAAATRIAWFQNQAETRQLLGTLNLTSGQIQKVIERIESGNGR